MEEEIREIRTPLEPQAFLNCSDESLREICKLMVELAETEEERLHALEEKARHNCRFSHLH